MNINIFSKLAIFSALLLIFSYFFTGNVITTLGVPGGAILSFFELIGGWIASLTTFGDLLFTDGTLFRVVRLAFYFFYFYFNYRFLLFIYRLFAN